MRSDLLEMQTRLRSAEPDAAAPTVLRKRAAGAALAARLASSLKRREREIVNEAVNEIFARWSSEINKYPLAREKTSRDMAIVLRYCLYAALMDDPAWVVDRMAAWFRTILNAYEINKTMVSDGYGWLQSAIQRRLPPDEAAAINPIIEEVRRVLAR